MSECFAELLEEEESLGKLDALRTNTLRTNKVVQGDVIEVGANVVVVHAGLKSEGIIPLEEFKDHNGVVDVHAGDKVEVIVEAFDNGFGQTKLSREKAKTMRAWESLEHSLNTDEIIKGVIVGRVKGGFTVELGNIRAFLPGSLVDVRPVRDPTYLEGKELDFKVIKLDQKRNNVVVSRRAAVESEHSEERDSLLENMEEGQILKGVVKNLMDYGAFVDLGGVDGLLHITDMAWKRIKHPAEMVEVGQEVEVKVLRFDKEKSRVSLGLKQMGDDPWSYLSRRYPHGSRLFGKVTNITDYGCFVEIEEGVEGLVHVSEIDWTSKNINPAKVVTIGDEVEVKVLDVEEDRRRISLSIKQCIPNPWEEFAETHNKGDIVSGQIKSITDFGIFMRLSNGIDGLIHLLDIAWDVPGEEAIRNYKKGQQIEAIILSVDPERERISLGIKQLQQDTFANFIAKHAKGEVVSGVVKSIEAKVAIIDLGDEVEGRLRIADLSQELVEDIHSVLTVGDAIKAKLITIDRKNRLIILSVKAIEESETNEAIKAYTQSAPGLGTANLGDLLTEQIKQTKEENNTN